MSAADQNQRPSHDERGRFAHGNTINQKVTVSDVSDAIERCGGVIVHAARKLNVHPDTIYDYMNKYPELKESVEKLRRRCDDELIDKSFFALNFALSKVNEDKRQAVDAAKFVIGLKGKQRGWSKTEVDSQANVEAMNKMVDLMSLIATAQTEIKSLKEENLRLRSVTGSEDIPM